MCGLRWGQIISISNKLPGKADAADSGPLLYGPEALHHLHILICEQLYSEWNGPWLKLSKESKTLFVYQGCQ